MTALEELFNCLDLLEEHTGKKYKLTLITSDKVSFFTPDGYEIFSTDEENVLKEVKKYTKDKLQLEKTFLINRIRDSQTCAEELQIAIDSLDGINDEQFSS